MTIALTALMLAAAVPATPPPVAPAEQRFAIGATGIILPTPPGYCVPQGNAEAAIAMVNAADTMNDTPAALVSCGPGVQPLDDYYLFKSPKQATAFELSRPVLLAGLGPAFKALDMNEVMDKVKSSLKDGFGDSITVGEGSMAPAGQDGVCGYLLGSFTVEAGGRQVRLTAAVCVTSIKRKVININHYEPTSAGRSKVQMLADVRAMAERMIAANEK
ncbi:hypothetical protein CAP39_03180 [Sphingomonas sp. IBVSS1]|nr:hypothetical protein CAP39_03180 [Sphingomonas sp. IBVSS1]